MASTHYSGRNMAKLTDMQIKAWIKAGERFEGRGDGDGLWLRYRESDKVPVWRFRYKLAGKPRTLQIGTYAELSLAKAREVAKAMAARVALGYDVAGEKQARKADAVAKMEAEQNAVTMLVLAIGLLVVVYARYYMSPADPVPRFFAFLLAFMGSMLGVVLSGNLVQLVVFWEVTSLFSFLLIGYWHQSANAREGARMALTVTAGAASIGPEPVATPTNCGARQANSASSG